MGHPKKRAYLIALSMCGNKVQAARWAGVSQPVIYGPTWEADEAFQTGMKAAERCAADLIEAAAFERAVHGVEKAAGWYKGVAGGTVVEYSDILAIFLLKGLRPEKYNPPRPVRFGSGPVFTVDNSCGFVTLCVADST